MQAYLKPSSALDDILALALREPAVRIRLFLGPNGERLWLKRAIALSMRFRLQRRDGRRAFDTELQALRVLGKAGLPVPEIVAEGPDHFVVADVGPTLAQVLRRPAMPFAKRAAAFRAAGAAIGQLHAAGYAHGRPAICDICWDGDAARFIDLEQFSGPKGTARKRAMDLVVFTRSYVAEMGAIGHDLDIAIEAYRTVAPADALQEAKKLAVWLYPLSVLMAPWYGLTVGAKKAKAASLSLAYLRNLSV